MQKLLAKLARGRKAIVAAATQVGAVVVLFVPTWGHGAQVAIGLLGSLISLALVYRVPNRKAHATTTVHVHVDHEKIAEAVSAEIGSSVGKK